MTLNATFQNCNTFNATFGSESIMRGSIESTVYVPTIDDYPGPYEFTPTESVQTVSAAGKRMKQNITINPIPSNYGLITWNGSTLTVS